MNYAQWINEAREFVRDFGKLHPESRATVEIEPPASSGLVEQIEHTIGEPIPAKLKEFITTASASAMFWATYLPPTPTALKEFQDLFDEHRSQFSIGADGFLHAQYLAQNLEACRDCVDNWIEYGIDASQLPKRAFPVFNLGNGDHIVVDSAIALGDSEVFLLSHDDNESPVTVLSPNFDEFLIAWQSIMYANPSFSEFLFFIDHERHTLSPTGPVSVAVLQRIMSTYP